VSDSSVTPAAAGGADVRLVDEHAHRVVALRVDSSTQAVPPAADAAAQAPAPPKSPAQAPAPARHLAPVSPPPPRAPAPAEAAAPPGSLAPAGAQGAFGVPAPPGSLAPVAVPPRALLGAGAQPAPRTWVRAEDLLRAQGRGRRFLLVRSLAVLLIAAGVLALSDAAVTLLWQEPISALIATLRQDHLSSALRAEEHAAPTPAEQRTLASLGDEQRRIAFLATELQRREPEGAAVGHISIPHIRASFVVVKGTSTADLQGGPGIFSDMSFPGASHTTAIAGHRTTYLAPFRHIDALRAGDRIRLNMPYAHFTYRVIGHRVVSPHDVAAAEADLGYTRLVLSACTPLFSAAKRLLVFATLTRTVPVGAARLLPGGELARPIEAPPPAVAVRAPLPPVLETLDPRVLAPLS
jgi:sortase A